MSCNNYMQGIGLSNCIPDINKQTFEFAQVYLSKDTKKAIKLLSKQYTIINFIVSEPTLSWRSSGEVIKIADGYYLINYTDGKENFQWKLNKEEIL